mmetsp:Transcript_33647/g.40316  ORF Transcript_33647/g.40316 Transcript_33647/m.40316 type:complete len:105 (-) Transcript_33647:31-345(-)
MGGYAEKSEHEFRRKRKNEESAFTEAMGLKSSVEIYLMKDHEHSKGRIRPKRRSLVFREEQSTSQDEKYYDAQRSVFTGSYARPTILFRHISFMLFIGKISQAI